MVDFNTYISAFIQNSKSIACFVLDQKGKIVYSNHFFDKIIGEVEGSTLGKNLFDILIYENHESIHLFLNKLYQTSSAIKIEWEIKNNTNEKFHLDVERHIIENEGKNYALGYVIDRSVEKKALLDTKYFNHFTNIFSCLVAQFYYLPDGTYGINYLGKGVEEFFGIKHKDILKDINLVWQYVVPEDKPTFISLIKKSVAEMNDLECIFRIKDINGNLKYVRTVGNPEKDENNKIVWNTISTDITKQKQTESAVIENQKTLMNLANQIPGVVFIYFKELNGNHGFSYFSDGFEELYGIDKSKALENPQIIKDQVHPEDLSMVISKMKESNSNMTKFDFQYRIIRPDGEIRYIHGFGNPSLKDNGTIIWNAVNLDITDRKTAELEANSSNTKLRAFIKSSPIAIYQIDLSGTVTDFWNTAAEQIYGWTRDEIIGKILPTIKDSDGSEFMNTIEEISITNRAKQFQISSKNKYKEELTLEITAGPLFDEHGILSEILIIASDITELEDYRKTLEKALREKEILLQEIHHRVKNNLAIVSGLLELQALKDENEYDMSVIIEARNRIHSIAMVHEQLYKDMDFSHINPKDYYNKLLKKLQINTLSNEPKIKYDLKFDIDKININRAVPLGLLINELFTNSIKHAFTDGKGNLKLHFCQTGNLIKVYYEDDGPGFVIDEIRKKNTIGWQLIETLLLQLDSEYIIDTNNRFMLEFTFQESLKGSQSIVKNQEINL